MAAFMWDVRELFLRYEAITNSALQVLPILLSPAILTNIQRLATFQESPWSGAYLTKSYTPEVQEKVRKVVTKRRKQFGQALADSSSFMCLIYLLFVWEQAARKTPERVADFDRLLMPVHLLVTYLCSLFQSGFVEFGDLSNTTLGIVLNGTLILGQFCMSSWSDRMAYREELFIACRLFAGCIFCDHRKALGCECFFIGLELLKSCGSFTGGPLEVCLMLLSSVSRWVIWYALEHFVQQFTSLTIQSADTSASLAAFRAVLSSQCDAEAYLGEDLFFVDPSQKLAHFFGVQPEELRNRSLTQFLSHDDQARVWTLVSSSVAGLSSTNSGPGTARCLTVTLHTGDDRQVEIQVCLSSVPATLGQAVSHVVALNEVKEQCAGPTPATVDEIIPEDAADIIADEQIREMDPAESAKPDSSAAGVTLNAENLAFHAWSSEPNTPQPCGTVHSVTLRFDPSTMEVSDISLSVKPKGNRSHRGRRVGLRECIVPGLWNDVNNWITKSLSVGTSQAPAIVPFAFPKMATEVMAARRSELKWVRSPGHGKELMLTLCDIRIRRFRERQQGSVVRAVGRGTCSAISRESFGSDARAHDDEEKQLARPWAPKSTRGM